MKKKYYVVILAAVLTISSIIAYYYFMPKTQTFNMEIDYSPGIEASALVQFQNEWYRRGSVMHIINNPN